MPDPKDGRLFNIQRFSTEDGPGIRTTVFFKGCPLTCPWCHNPEGMTRRRLLVWYAVRCIDCGDCESACPEGALTRSDGRVVIDRRCLRCGTCVDACPAAALELVGRDYTLEEIFDEVARDRTFYETSGGGVTFSGGEPLSQAAFVERLADRLRRDGIHVALDTTGVGPPGALDRLLPCVDLVLLDVKVIDRRAHRRLTGVPVDAVLEALEKIAAAGLKLWVRTPIIPGLTDDPDNVRAIAAHLRDHAPTLERWDLLAFENTCRSKYELFGLPFELAGEPLVGRERMEDLCRRAAAEGVNVVRWSGPVFREITRC